MKKRLALPVLLAATALRAATHETEWCTAVMPDTAKAGDAIHIDVTLKKDPGANKLAAHLHWLQTDSGAWAGVLAVGEPQDAKAGEVCRFTFKPDINPAAMLSILPLVFLAPDGDFNRLAEKADPGLFTYDESPCVNLVGGHEQLDGKSIAFALLDANANEIFKFTLRNGLLEGLMTQGSPTVERIANGFKLSFLKLKKSGLFALVASEPEWGEPRLLRHHPRRPRRARR